jgi:probable Rubsico expression protein CbbX
MSLPTCCNIAVLLIAMGYLNISHGYRRRVSENSAASDALSTKPPTHEQLSAFNLGTSELKSRTSSNSRAVAPTMEVDLDDTPKNPEAGNYRRLSDRLKEADVERRLEEEEKIRQENAWEMAKQEKKRKYDFFDALNRSQPVGYVKDFMYKDGVPEVIAKLDNDLIGLQAVKDRVREIAALLVVDKMRMKIGLETFIPSLHMSFTGSPGTGKTTVALRMGEILQRMGYCRRGHVVIATRDDLVGQYVGHTAPKTKEMVKKAMGGILFVDEAYYLYNADNDRDYGQESIDILVDVMEHKQEDIIVVVAGYEDRIQQFFSYVPALSSRIGNHIRFPDYEPNELGEIGSKMVEEMGFKPLDKPSRKVLEKYIAARKKLPFFANARTVRNAMDVARMRQSLRLYKEKKDAGLTVNDITKDDFATLTKADFPKPSELKDDVLAKAQTDFKVE